MGLALGLAPKQEFIERKVSKKEWRGALTEGDEDEGLGGL